jgi:hypothetical protein
VLNEYCVFTSTPLSEEIVPLPSFKPPFHSADALRFMLVSSVRSRGSSAAGTLDVDHRAASGSANA